MSADEAIWSRRLYVIQFKSGLIKIGITTNGRRRESTLRSLAGPMARIHYGDVHSCGYLAERLLIERVRRIGCTFKGREWFTNIGFGAACTLVAQMTRKAVAQDRASTSLPA